ncbi:MAG: acyloxyacyl hydrolase [Acidobacteriota bacterium]
MFDPTQARNRRPVGSVVVAIVILCLSEPLAARPLRKRLESMRFAGAVAAGGRSFTTRHGQAEMETLRLEWSIPWSPRTEITLNAGPSRFNQPRSWFGDRYMNGNENVRAGGAGITVRRYFGLQSRVIRAHVELGSGPIWSERRVPAATSLFNFISEVTAGVTLRPWARLPIIVGYRFSHLSNGGYSSRNPGWNVSSIVIGTRIRR